MATINYIFIQHFTPNITILAFTKQNPAKTSLLKSLPLHKMPVTLHISPKITSNNPLKSPSPIQTSVIKINNIKIINK